MLNIESFAIDSKWFVKTDVQILSSLHAYLLSFICTGCNNVWQLTRKEVVEDLQYKKVILPQEGLLTAYMWCEGKEQVYYILFE